MNTYIEPQNRRLLVIDDNEAIHSDFRKIIGHNGPDDSELAAASELLFGGVGLKPAVVEGFEIDSAHQGQEGLKLVERALAEGRPYSLAFVDMRMPPGWDGVETVRRIWQVDPNLLIVFCTAFSDYSWADMKRVLGRSDHFLLLKKPFDNAEVRQLAEGLSARWQAARGAERQLRELEHQLAELAHAAEVQEPALCAQVAEARHSAAQARAAEHDFLRAMTCEIETPATAIVSFAELLRVDGDLSRAPPRRLQTIDSILDNAHRLLESVERLKPRTP